MISILQRYIARTVIFATLLVILVVLGLTYFIGLLGELRDIGVGDYGFLQAALHALLELPHAIYLFFPMLVLLGGVMGLGMLATHQELIVMRISGVSVRRITLAVLSSALVLILIGLVVGELLAPKMHSLANKHKSMSQSGGQAVATASGVWVHEGDNFIHIDRVLARRHFEGIVRYEFNTNHKLLAAYYAKSLDYRDKKWFLQDVVKTTFGPDRTSQQAFPEATWNLSLQPNLLSVGLIEPSEMPITKEWQYIRHLVTNGLQATEFQFDFWKRVLQPLTILVMLFLAVPFVFAAGRTVTMGWRILLGVITGFVFYTFGALLGQISVVFQLSPFFAALLPILVFAGIGYFFLVK